MKRDKLENALHQIITIKFEDNKKETGYLVRDRYNSKKYSILPLSVHNSIISFGCSSVKSYIFWNNKFEVK